MLARVISWTNGSHSPPLSPRPVWRVALQVLLVSAYTGIMTPIICAALKPLGHWLWPATTDRR